jgi:hypothetical protein
MRYLAVICVMLASLSGAVAQMTHEETMVRTAYAKFAYAVQQGAIGRLAIEADNRGVTDREPPLTSGQRLASAQVDFTLSDFVVGDVRDITNRKAIDLISPADGEMLEPTSRNVSYSDRGLATGWQSFELEWQPAHPLPAITQTLTISELYELQWHEQWPQAMLQRYASYSVKAIYQGKTRGPYKALFLFGRDAQGNEVILPQDGTTNAAFLGIALTLHLFPDAFVSTRLRTLPVVASWLNANQTFDASCSAGKGDVCCDLAKLKCGLAHADLTESLSKPLPSNSH